MKKLTTITKKSFILYMSMALCIGLWSCKDDDDPILTPTIATISPSSGEVGDAVTITGTNFSATPADNAVSFNGTAATVTASTVTSITTTVPVGATTGDVTVTVGGETSVGSSFTVTVPAVIPTITSLNPTSGEVGATVAITGTNFSATPADNTVSFHGTAATVTASTATSITTTVPVGATTGNVTVTVDSETSTGVLFTVEIGTTITVAVADSCDDAEEYRGAFETHPDGEVELHSSDLELCTEDSAMQQVVGILFRNIQIPVGATITNAYIQFTADDTNTEGVLPIDIWGIQEANTSAPFTEVLFDISSRPSTTATVNWQAPIWAVKQEKGPDQATPDLKAIVQEIIDLAGWASGNTIGFQFTNDETAKIHREAESYDDNATEAGASPPELVVTYTEAK